MGGFGACVGRDLAGLVRGRAVTRALDWTVWCGIGRDFGGIGRDFGGIGARSCRLKGDGTGIGFWEWVNCVSCVNYFEMSQLFLIFTDLRGLLPIFLRFYRFT